MLGNPTHGIHPDVELAARNHAAAWDAGDGDPVDPHTVKWDIAADYALPMMRRRLEAEARRLADPVVPQPGRAALAGRAGAARG